MYTPRPWPRVSALLGLGWSLEFSFLIAAKILGVWGVILAPAIAAMILTLFDELYIKTINAKGKSFEE